MKTLKLTLQQAQSIYKTADADVKTLLEANFGKKELIGRPLGIWCLSKDKRAFKASEWNKNLSPLAVGVVTENTSFMVHLQAQAALPFGSTDVTEYDDIVFDTTTFENEQATQTIIEAHSEVKGYVWGDDKFPFYGAPAAEYCDSLDGCLPTLATAKELQANIKAINEAMLEMAGDVVCGWLWTSTLKKSGDGIFAFVVNMDNGSVSYGNRDLNYGARAVSAFDFEEFKF